MEIIIYPKTKCDYDNNYWPVSKKMEKYNTSTFIFNNNISINGILRFTIWREYGKPHGIRNSIKNVFSPLHSKNDYSLRFPIPALLLPVRFTNRLPARHHSNPICPIGKRRNKVANRKSLAVLKLLRSLPPLCLSSHACSRAWLTTGAQSEREGDFSGTRSQKDDRKSLNLRGTRAGTRQREIAGEFVGMRSFLRREFFIRRLFRRQRETRGFEVRLGFLRYGTVAEIRISMAFCFLNFDFRVLQCIWEKFIFSFILVYIWEMKKKLIKLNIISRYLFMSLILC